MPSWHLSLDREHKQERPDLAAVREAVATVYRQDREIEDRYPEKFGLVEPLSFVSIINDMDAYAVSQDAQDRKARIEEIAKDGIKQSWSAESIRRRTMDVLNDFAAKHGLQDRLFRAPTGKMIGTAPVTEDWTIDYEQTTKRGLEDARRYDVMAQSLPEKHRERVGEALERAKKAAIKALEYETPDKSINDEQAQLKAVSTLVHTLERVGKALGDEGRFRVDDFVSAHENRRQQAREMLEKMKAEREARRPPVQMSI